MEAVSYYPSRVWSLAIHISLSSFIYCYGLSAMNSCTENIGVTLGWGDSYLMTSLFTTLYPIGCLFGTITSASLIENLGCRRCIVVGNILFISGNFICIIPSNYTFGAGRFITGFIGGLFIAVSPMFINEITPDAMTGKVGTLVQQSCSLSFVFAFLAGLAVPTENLETDPWNYLWMAVIFLPSLACFYQLYYFLAVFKHESPGWLLKQGKEEEARNSLLFVYAPSSVDVGIKRLAGPEEHTSTNNEDILLDKGDPSYKAIFCTKPYRKMLRIAVILNVGQEAVGCAIILLYSTSMFETIGGGKFIAKVLTLGVGLVQLFSGLSAIPLLGRYGRKSMLVLGQIFVVVDLMMIGFFTGLIDAGVAAISACLFLYFVPFTLSMGAVFWAIIGEVLNKKCMSIGITANLSSLTVLIFIFPVANNFIGISGVFFVLAGLSLLLLVYIMLDVFETKGLTKQEILKKVMSVH